MKRNVVWKFWVFLYVNVWYVPFLALLLGAKISLISFLINKSVHQRDDRYHNLTNEIIKIVSQRAAAGSGKSVKKIRSVNNNAVRVEGKNRLGDEDFRMLSSLETAKITPSSSNRTDPDGIWLVFNQVPWGGGHVLSDLLEKMQERNGFKFLVHEYRTPWPRFLLQEEQENLVTWFEYQHLPVAYDRHFYFVNFTKYHKFVMENPIYINMVQHPASRLHAAFQWKRSSQDRARAEVDRRNSLVPGSGSSWLNDTFDSCVIEAHPECSYENGTEDYTMAIPFFCGQHNSCVILNNHWALQSAKFNIERYYAVVGILERLEDTLRVLQNYIPRFFSNAAPPADHGVAAAVGVGNEEPPPPSPSLPPSTPVSPPALKILKGKLAAEFELYKFIQQRLQLQLNAMDEAAREKSVRSLPPSHA